jgi:hypothetical protein
MHSPIYLNGIVNFTFYVIYTLYTKYTKGTRDGEIIYACLHYVSELLK